MNIAARTAGSRLGPYYERRPDGGSSLFVKAEAKGAQLVALRIYVGLEATDKAQGYAPNMLQWQPGEVRGEVETPLHSHSPHDHMILRVGLGGSHWRWKRPCIQTAHMTICILTRETGGGAAREDPREGRYTRVRCDAACGQRRSCELYGSAGVVPPSRPRPEMHWVLS